MKPHRAFLVRCWCEASDAGNQTSEWRFLVIEIGVAPQPPRGFADLEQLGRHLSSELSDSALDPQTMESPENLVRTQDKGDI